MIYTVSYAKPYSQTRVSDVKITAAIGRLTAMIDKPISTFGTLSKPTR